jgi:hypothetical protein
LITSYDIFTYEVINLRNNLNNISNKMSTNNVPNSVTPAFNSNVKVLPIKDPINVSITLVKEARTLGREVKTLPKRKYRKMDHM